MSDIGANGISASAKPFVPASTRITPTASSANAPAAKTDAVTRNAAAFQTCLSPCIPVLPSL